MNSDVLSLLVERSAGVALVARNLGLLNFRLGKGPKMNLTSIVRPMAAGAIAIAAISVVAIPVTLAQDSGSVLSSPVETVAGAVQEITLTMGKGGLFQTSAPFAKLSVSDEKIVEVTPQSDREFIFNPKSIGATNVFVFDGKNMLIARVDVNVVSRTAKAPEVREERSGEAPGTVRVYNRIYDDKGVLARPALYQCNGKNCEISGEALGADPVQSRADPLQTGRAAASPQVDATVENENAQ
jgi:Flp pilus assembly secretin CpaC